MQKYVKSERKLNCFTHSIQYHFRQNFPQLVIWLFFNIDTLITNAEKLK